MGQFRDNPTENFYAFGFTFFFFRFFFFCFFLSPTAHTHVQPSHPHKLLPTHKPSPTLPYQTTNPDPYADPAPAPPNMIHYAT